MRRTFAVSALCLAATVPVYAQSSVLTLDDALAAAARDSTTAAADALRFANEGLSQASGAPRTSLNTTVSAQPMAGSPLQYLALPQFTVDFGSSVRQLGALQTVQSELAQSSATLAATRRATILTVIDAFFDAATDQSRLATQNDAVALAQRGRKIALLRLEQGAAPQLDVERAQAELAAAEAERDAARVALRDDLAALGELVGGASPVTVALPDLPVALPNAQAVADAALHVNPAVRAAQAMYSAAQSVAVLARAELAPDVSAGVGPGYSRVGSAQSVAPAGSVTLSIPFGNRLQHASVSAADAAVLVAKAGLDQDRRRAVHDALHARRIADGAIARLEKLRSADASARRVADADLTGYQLGAVTSSDVVVADSRAANTRAALENALVEAARAYVGLEIEMGALPT